jgi:hypothetical protein
MSMRALVAAFARALPWRRAQGAPRARFRTASVLGACAILAACSGGSGRAPDDGANSGPPTVGVVSVAVTDTFGSPVAGATVTATLDGSSVSGATDAQGLALLPVTWPSGTAEVVVVQDSFLDAVVSTPVTAGDVNAVTVTLDRTTAAAGGSLPSGSGAPATVDGGRARFSFEVELLVVDRDAQPIGGLDAGDFSLLPCTPDAAREGDECVAGGDAAYTPVTASPESLQLVPAGAAQPFAAALLMDQSGSIAQSDPTGARLFAAKSMLVELAPDDQVLLAAFAAPPNALIPTAPLTLYPPIRGQADASGYFAELDALGSLLGGNTPLYTSIDAVVAQIAGDPAVPAGKALAIVRRCPARPPAAPNAVSRKSKSQPWSACRMWRLNIQP